MGCECKDNQEATRPHKLSDVRVQAIGWLKGVAERDMARRLRLDRAASLRHGVITSSTQSAKGRN